MSQSNQNISKYFPRLNIDVLKIHAARWAARWPEVPIDRIILYNYASEFQMYYDEPIKYKKYAIVFEVSILDILPVLTDKGRFRYDFAVASGIISPTSYYKFVKDIEYDTSVIQEKKYKALITADFTNVYWNTPEDTFIKEWVFIPRPLIYNPKEKKQMPIGLLANVRVDEPHIILFQTEEISQEEIPFVDIQDETTEQAPKTFKADLSLADVIQEVDLAIKNQKYVFSRIGKNWLIKYEETLTTLPDHQKIRYIVHLLDNPGISIHVFDLLKAVKKEIFRKKIEEQSDGMESAISEWEGLSEEQLNKEGVGLSDLVIDDLTKEEKNNLEDIGYKIFQELEDAKKNKNGTNIKEAKNKIEQYKNYMVNEYGIKVLISSKGIKYIQKSRPGPEAEKARKNVGIQIKNAINDIEKEIPLLGQHLHKHIEKGLHCIYNPDDSRAIDWYITL